jgi:hypothetical protein
MSEGVSDYFEMIHYPKEGSIFTENIAEHLFIDETCLSQGEPPIRTLTVRKVLS